MTTAEIVPWLTHKAIEEKADLMREAAGCLSAPIDPMRIAQSLGIGVYNATFSDEAISGMLRWVAGEAQILVNQNQVIERIRYTVAHELGHFDLHSGMTESFVDTDMDFYRREADNDDPIKKRVEVQANMFAAALLMPRALVTEAYRISPHYSLLSEMFFVSPQAMKFRIANLGIG